MGNEVKIMEEIQVSPVNSAKSIQRLHQNHVAILETLLNSEAEPWIFRFEELKWQIRTSPLWYEVMVETNGGKLRKDSFKLHKTWHNQYWCARQTMLKLMET